MDKKIWIIVILVPFIILLNNIRVTTLSHDFYIDEFASCGVYNNFNNSMIPDEAARKLIDYFQNNERGLVNINIFTIKEKEHLLDVKVLLKRMIFVLGLLVAISITLIIRLFLLRKSWKKLGKLLFYGGISTIVFVILVVVILLNFDFAFTKFHHIFFPQGNWMFSYDSGLIKLFPKEFFFDFCAEIILKSFTQGALFFVVGYVLQRKIRKSSVKSKKYLNSKPKK